MLGSLSQKTSQITKYNLMKKCSHLWSPYMFDSELLICQKCDMKRSLEWHGKEEAKKTKHLDFEFKTDETTGVVYTVRPLHQY